MLTEIEQAVIANDPSPDGGAWEAARLINFHQGLARLTLSVRSTTGQVAPRGTILVQNFTLADGTLCLKANLAWRGTDATMVSAVYSKPDTNWRGEAGQIAVKWLDGQVTAAATDVPMTTPASNPPMESAADGQEMKATG